jgi:PleD family two-component response regulator
MATLEAQIADPGLVGDADEAAHLRVTLYRVFTKIWSSLELNKHRSDFAQGDSDAPTRNLEGVTPLARQVFLLRSVEGFTALQAADILECDTDRISELLDQAGREIAAQVATDVLIIEDEPLIAMDLAVIVESLGHRVVARTRTHAEAFRAAQRTRPGLVLADIQGSSGLKAVKELVQAMDVAVIFITAFPERVLTG